MGSNRGGQKTSASVSLSCDLTLNLFPLCRSQFCSCRVTVANRFFANNPFEIPPKIKTVLLLIVALVVAVAVLIVAPTCFGHRLPNIGHK